MRMPYLTVNLTKQQKYSATKQETDWVFHNKIKLIFKTEFTSRGFEKFQQTIKLSPVGIESTTPTITGLVV